MPDTAARHAGRGGTPVAQPRASRVFAHEIFLGHEEQERERDCIGNESLTSIKIDTYLFVTEDPFHILNCDTFSGDEAMLNGDGDFSPNENVSSYVRGSEDIVRLDHDSMDRIFLRDKSHRTLSQPHRLVHVWSKSRVRVPVGMRGKHRTQRRRVTRKFTTTMLPRLPVPTRNPATHRQWWVSQHTVHSRQSGRKPPGPVTNARERRR